MLRGLLTIACCLPAICQALQIDVQGVTAIPETEINQILQSYRGADLDVEDAVRLADLLNRRYAELGYVTSGVVLPAAPEGDRIVLQAIEGTLGEVRVRDSGRLSRRFLSQRISRYSETPFNISNVQRAFTILEQDPAISALRGELVPGQRRGEAILELTAIEAPAFTVALGVNNYASPSVGADQVELELKHVNLSGRADHLHLSLRDGEGLTSGSLRYQFPVSRLNARTTLLYSKGDSLVVEAPFEPLDIRSETDTLSLSMAFRFFELGTSAFEVGFGIEKKSSETWLLDLPFDFSPGSVDGKSNASVAEIFARFNVRKSNQALATQITWRRGLSIWSATELPASIPDGEFSAFQWYFGYARQFSLAERDLNLNLRARGQLTTDTLQSFERIALGGHASVRGYRENQVLMDEGWEARLQLDTQFGNHLLIFPFLDAAHGQNSGERLNVRNAISLRSLGIGARATFGGLSFLVEWAKRLNEKQELDDTLQDKGFHIGLRYERTL
ncbi:MAG: ShlB/FhaC/HecB family hemolysin secretion/activation protein [Pseudomonadota bacterium]